MSSFNSVLLCSRFDCMMDNDMLHRSCCEAKQLVEKDVPCQAVEARFVLLYMMSLVAES